MVNEAFEYALRCRAVRLRQQGVAFGIYRGSGMANAVKAIGAAYPVIEKIVGVEFFTGVAREYWSRVASEDSSPHRAKAGRSKPP